jgi:hypothetical protein
VATAVNTALKTAEDNAISGVEDYGTLPPSTTYDPILFDKTAEGDPGGTSDWRAFLNRTTYSGAYGANQVDGFNQQFNINHTSGNLTFAYGIQGYNSLGGPGASGVPTGTVTACRGIEWHTANKSSNSAAISEATDFFASDVDLDRTGANGTIGTMRGFFCGDQGHASRVTVASVGFDAANMTGGAPITAAFRSQMSSGTGKWTFLGAGSAPSSFAGKVRVGDNTEPTTFNLEVVNGDIGLMGAGRALWNNGLQVLGQRQTGCPSAATDLATAITLLNFIRTALITHGVIS